MTIARMEGCSDGARAADTVADNACHALWTQVSDTRYATRSAGDPVDTPARAADQTAKTAEQPLYFKSATEFVDAAKKFQSAQDPKEAMKELGPTFERTIKEAGNAYDQIFAKAQSELDATNSGSMTKGLETLNKSSDDLIAQVAKLSPEESRNWQDFAGQRLPKMMQTYLDSGRDSPEGKKARYETNALLASIIGVQKSTDILDAVDKTFDAYNDPAAQKFLKDVSRNLAPKLLMLDAYTDMLQRSGDPDKAKLVAGEMLEFERTAAPRTVQQQRAAYRDVRTFAAEKIGVAPPDPSLGDLERFLKSSSDRK